MRYMKVSITDENGKLKTNSLINSLFHFYMMDFSDEEFLLKEPKLVIGLFKCSDVFREKKELDSIGSIAYKFWKALPIELRWKYTIEWLIKNCK